MPSQKSFGQNLIAWKFERANLVLRIDRLAILRPVRVFGQNSVAWKLEPANLANRSPGSGLSDRILGLDGLNGENLVLQIGRLGIVPPVHVFWTEFCRLEA